MPRPELPRVEAFFIPRLRYRFVDMRALTGREQGDVENAWVKWLIDEYESKMDDRRQKMGLCDWDLVKRDRLRDEFHRLLEANPDYTWDDFEQEGRTYRYDHELDPRLPAINLGIFSGREVVGKMPLMNIRVERDRDGTRTASFQGTPGVRPAEGLTRAQTWATIYRYLLEQDLTFRGGQVLDLVEVRFPSDQPGYRFKPEPWNDLGAMFAEVRGGDFDEERATEDGAAVKRLRRRARRADGGRNLT